MSILIHGINVPDGPRDRRAARHQAGHALRLCQPRLAALATDPGQSRARLPHRGGRAAARRPRSEPGDPQRALCPGHRLGYLPDPRRPALLPWPRAQPLDFCRALCRLDRHHALCGRLGRPRGVVRAAAWRRFGGRRSALARDRRARRPARGHGSAPRAQRDAARARSPALSRRRPAGRSAVERRHGRPSRIASANRSRRCRGKTAGAAAAECRFRAGRRDNRVGIAAGNRPRNLYPRPHGRLDRACHRAVSKRCVDPAARALYRPAARRGEPGLTEASATSDWRDDIFTALKAAGIRQVGYVPDAGHSRLIELCHADPAIRAIPLTSEEEGIGLAVGAWLGGQRAALLMQSSGVGNCINLLSLAKSCRFPLTMLVTMRGEWGEFNPWQVPMGTKTQAALELMDVLVYRVERADETGETVAAAFEIAFNGSLATAGLFSPRLSGAQRGGK